MARAMLSLRAALKDESIARALGFWESRMAVLDRIAVEFPSLKTKALDAKKGMETSFGAGRDALLKLYLSRGDSHAENWEEAREQALAAASKQSLVEADLAKALEARELDPANQQLRYVQLFLIMQERHAKNPVLALEHGFVMPVPIGEKDAPPLGTIEVPKTFGLISTRAESDLTLAFGGFGPAIITIAIHPLEEPINARQAVENLAANTAQSDRFLPATDNARYFRTALGEAALVPVELNIKTEKVRAKGVGSLLSIPTPTHLVGLTMTVNAPDGPDQAESLRELSELFEPLFERVRASVAVAKDEQK